MQNLALFVMATVGLTNILIFGSILEPLRGWLQPRLPERLYELFTCYQCMGTWVGFLTGYVILTHEPFMVLMCGFAGSFAAHYAALGEEYLQANSLVDIGTHDDEGR